jgi:hypothetical protein
MPAQEKPLLWVVFACVALAALSAAVLPTVPSYDPWSWIVWGREVVDPHLTFATDGGPSWKPLPVMFTTVYALFGSAAPTLWVVTARAGGLLALGGAWRLASKLARAAVGDRAPSAAIAAPVAGLSSVLGLALTQNFFYYMFRGTSEPILIAAALWAVERLIARRHRQAFVLTVGVSLLRPEAWPFLVCYALWLWLREPGTRPLVLLGLLSIPVLWFVPPWIGSGQPFLAATHAREYNGHLGDEPVITVLRRAADLQVAPVLLAAAIALGSAWIRDRDRLTLALAAGSLAWITVVVAMAIDGYPGLERFFYPASALFCVLAGVGVARVAVLVGGRIGRPAGAMGTIVAATVLLAVCIPLSSSRIDSARAQKPAADRAVRVLDELSAAVRVVGGRTGVFPCRSSFAAVNHGVQTALAWKLHVTMGRIGTDLRKPGVDFIGPHNSVDGVAAWVAPRLTQMQTIATVGVWRVARVMVADRSERCVGR